MPGIAAVSVSFIHTEQEFSVNRFQERMPDEIVRCNYDVSVVFATPIWRIQIVFRRLIDLGAGRVCCKATSWALQQVY